MRAPANGAPSASASCYPARVTRVCGDASADPRAACALKEEEAGEQNEECNRGGERQRAGRPVGVLGHELRGLGRCARASTGRNRHGLRVRAFADHRGRQVDPVSGTGGGDVLHAPGALQHVGDRRVHGLEGRRGRRAVVLAAGRARELLERSRREAGSLDPDRVHGRVGVTSGRDRRLQRLLARVVGAVTQDDDHAAGQGIPAGEASCEDDAVVQGRSSRRIDLEVRERGIAVERRRAERRSADVCAPNETTATSSAACFAPTKERAARDASASGLPRMDCERSIARTIAFARPRFCNCRPATAEPFSEMTGATWRRPRKRPRRGSSGTSSSRRPAAERRHLWPPAARGRRARSPG